MAHNLAVDRQRRNTTEAFDFTGAKALRDLNQDPAPNAGQKVIEQERQKKFHAALAQLSPQERRCLDLRAEGLAYRETGGRGTGWESAFAPRTKQCRRFLWEASRFTYEAPSCSRCSTRARQVSVSTAGSQCRSSPTGARLRRSPSTLQRRPAPCRCDVRESCSTRRRLR